MTRTTADGRPVTLPEIELMRMAWPERHGQALCAWCDQPRLTTHALCRPCWLSVSINQRAKYLKLALVDRARWILNRKAQGA